MSMSSVTIIGRLTADPEQKIPASGNPYTRLRIAWNDKKDQPGYIDATLFGKTGEVAALYLRKGNQFCLSGAKLEWRQYEKDDEKRTAYSLVGGTITLLGSKADNEQTTQSDASIVVASTDADVPF